MSFENNASYIINEVEITKLWGKYNIQTSFDKDINIFIGINGSYKTTFIRLLYNLLTLDLIKLIDIDFKSIKLQLKSGKKNKIVSFTKHINKYEEKEYTFELEGIDKICLTETDLKHFNRFFRGEDDFDEFDIDDEGNDFTLKSKFSFLKNHLSKLINVDYLNIDRHSNYERPYYMRHDQQNIDDEIRKLVRQFIRYQSEIKTSINKCSNDFLKKAFENLLTNQYSTGRISFDSDLLDDCKNIINKISNDKMFIGIDLTDASKLLDETKALIEKVFRHSKINKKIKKTLSMNEITENLEGNEISIFFRNISLLPKFQAMHDLYKNFEKEKLEIEQPTQVFLDISNSFLRSSLFPNKSLIISDDGSLGLKICDDNTVTLRRLSSGEKQLIIILLSTLLQKKKKGVYITDEPELSLHISWQEKLITAINQINPNIQLILATHSPDIVSKYEKHIKQMEDILTNEEVG